MRGALKSEIRKSIHNEYSNRAIIVGLSKKYSL